MMLGAASALPTPVFDWHALAPDIVLVATLVVVLVADLLLPERESWPIWDAFSSSEPE